MKFVHLHTHSHYSLLDGLAKIDDIIDRAKELGMKAVALTDHGNLYGAIEFYKKAVKAEIKPILGVETYVAPRSRFEKENKIDDQYSHLILLCENNTGWKNLIQLVTKSYLEGFYYKPRVDKEILKEHHEGLIALSACVAGEISQLILNRNLEEAEKAVREYQEIFGKENFFLEIGYHPNFADAEKANIGLKKLSEITGAPLVATQDIHYMKPEDAEYHDILLAVQTGNKTSDDDRLTLKADDFSMRSQEDMMEIFKDTPEAIENTVKIAERCDISITLNKILLPTFQLPENENSSIEYLKKLANERLPERFEIADAKITERLDYELGVIEKTGFADYFLIVQDFVNWAKERGIVVGPGRGSAAGSLVSYVLGITDLDPLKYDLLFERFLNPDRISMPDIDLDFTDVRRDEVFGYIREKYGEDKVAQIITFGTMAARAAIRDAGRALGMPYSLCDQLSKMIPFNPTQGMKSGWLDKSLQKVAEFKEIYETNPDAKKIIDAARHFEGVARHASVHACGIVISKDTLTDFVPLQRAPQDSNIIITQFEMHSIEDLGLLKMDLLGLKNLTIIEEGVRLIKEISGDDINISKLPLDDKKVFKLLQEGDTTGVFQLECLSGETIVSNTTIKKLYQKQNKKTLNSVYLDQGKIHKNKIINVLKRGNKKVYSLIADNGWYIKTTLNHYFLTENGWKKLKDIKIGEKILMKTKARHSVYNICNSCGKQINGQKEGKSDFCYKCSAAFYRNPSKKESREKIQNARLKFYQGGGKPWNCGLTAENNETLKNTALKISKALAGKSFEYRFGKERADEIKKSLSNKFKGAGNPMFGKRPPHRNGGLREDLGHYVRSNWEADFARILNLYNLKYEYEPKTFPLIKSNGEILNYTPDFYVKSDNTFYEIKGWFHDLDREKVELFQKQYPQYNFTLVNTTKFAELALKYKNLVKWECPRIPVKNSFKFIDVKEIKYSGVEETYDIAMETPGNNFVANGFVVHNSSGMRRYLKDLKPNEFEDIIAMVALYRPGPIELIPSFVNRKHGKEKVTYLHPKLEPILESTYGIGIYQEQMMKIAQEIGGFTLAEADTLRKAIGKKIKSLLDSQKEKFIEGGINNGIDKKIAEEIWNLFPPFARYGFNKSHAACYALIAYRTAYLKAYWPIEFMTALLNSDSGDTDRISFLMSEAQKKEIKILPPDANSSFANFAPEEKNIRFGLLAIKNVGAAIVEAIIEERQRGGPYQNMTDFLTRVRHKDLNKKSLESMIKVGVFDSFGMDRGVLLANLDNILTFCQNIKKSQNSSQTGLFGNNYHSPALFEKNKEGQTALPKDKLAWERELLGLYVSGHPLSAYFEKLKKFNPTPIKKILAEKEGSNGDIAQIAGVILNIHRIVSKLGQQILFVTVEDLSGSVEIIVFSDTLAKNPAIWRDNNIIIANGKVSWRNGEPKFICQQAIEL